MKLCEKPTVFRVNLCCFSTVGISGLQPHAQLRSIYILRLCMRLFCPAPSSCRTYIGITVSARQAYTAPNTDAPPLYYCFIRQHHIKRRHSEINRSKAHKQKSIPPKQIPIQRVKAPRGCFFISARSAPTYSVKYYVPTQVAPTRSPFIRRAG